MKAWKGVMMVMCVMIAAGLVLAGGDAKDAKVKTHKESAEIVSVDVENKIIVIKGGDGVEHKAPVMGKALDNLKNWKAGDKVIVVCEDDDAGEHKGVVEIMRAEAAPAEKK